MNCLESARQRFRYMGFLFASPQVENVKHSLLHSETSYTSDFLKNILRAERNLRWASELTGSGACVGFWYIGPFDSRIKRMQCSGGATFHAVAYRIIHSNFSTDGGHSFVSSFWLRANVVEVATLVFRAHPYFVKLFRPCPCPVVLRLLFSNCQCTAFRNCS